MKTKTLLTLLTAAFLALWSAPAKADHVTVGCLFTNLVFTNSGTFTVTGGNVIRLPRDTGIALLPVVKRAFSEGVSTFELRWSFSVDGANWTTPRDISSAVDGSEGTPESFSNAFYEYFPQSTFSGVVYAKIGEVRISSNITNLTVNYSFFNGGPRSTNLPSATATATLQ